MIFQLLVCLRPSLTSGFCFKEKAVHSSPIREALKCPDLNQRNPFLRSPSVFLLVKNIYHSPPLCKLLGIGDLCFHVVFLYTYHRAEAEFSISVQQVVTTCPQGWSHAEVHPICRASSSEGRGHWGFMHLLFFVCTLPWAAGWDQPAGRFPSPRHWCQSAAGSTTTTKREILL